MAPGGVQDRGNFRLGQIAGEYLARVPRSTLRAGSRPAKWQDKAGVDHYTTEVLASDMQMLDSHAMPVPAAITAHRVNSRRCPRAACRPGGEFTAAGGGFPVI